MRHWLPALFWAPCRDRKGIKGGGSPLVLPHLEPNAGSNHGFAHMEVGDGREVQRGARSEWAGAMGTKWLCLNPTRGMKFRLTERWGKWTEQHRKGDSGGNKLSLWRDQWLRNGGRWGLSGSGGMIDTPINNYRLHSGCSTAVCIVLNFPQWLIHIA